MLPQGKRIAELGPSASASRRFHLPHLLYLEVLHGGELGNSLHWPKHAMTSSSEECNKNVSDDKSKHVTRKKKKKVCFKFQVKPREAEIIFKEGLGGAGQQGLASFQRQVTALSCSQKRRGKPEFIPCTLYISRFARFYLLFFSLFKKLLFKIKCSVS